MALSEYKEKRSFHKTPEPTGGKPSTTRLAFVVQKHHASHLHYDFRLEMRGILKSWAVPKGPSMNPQEKRLAMLVEDHPYDYKDFEGIIPAGNYGAGSVIVWDQGWYEPAEEIKEKKAQEHELLKQFYSGKLTIKLHGKKLKGNFTLVKNPARGETSWLLTKVKDQDALTIDISTKDKSVISGKTVEEVADDSNATQWQSNRTSTTGTDIKSLIKKGKKSAMPNSIQPMLATKSEGIMNNDQYLYEVKWDGFRIISFVKNGNVRLDSRGHKNYTSRYPLVVDALKELKRDVVLDGEMVVFNEDGKPDFNRVQNYNSHRTPISYYVFDIIHLDGYDLKVLPLEERKAILKELIQGNGIIRLSESFYDGEGLYELMKEKGWEGVVAKRQDSPYIEDDRSNRWLKFPVQKIDEFVIGGWAESDKARDFRSILFGAYDKKGDLQWLGRSGGGYKEEEMPRILSKLKKFGSNKSPFVNKVLDTKGTVIHWLKPELVANFQYAEMTATGRIRKPAIWKGFREDKDPRDIQIPEVKKFGEAMADQKSEASETKKPSGHKNQAKKTSSRHKKYPYLNKDSGWERVDEEQKGADWQDFEMEECTIAIHSLERELWDGVPKGQILIYYTEMADFILPYLKDRPQSLNLKLSHAGAPRVFIKDMENRQPGCSDVFVDKRRHNTEKGKRDQIDYLVCNNRETLIYMADLGCVDINPWASRTEHIHEPDYLSIDLDPTIADDLKGPKRLHSENEGFEKAAQVAIAAKKIFDKYKLTTFIKTSGQTGLHIYIPCSGFVYKQPRQLAFKLAEKIQAAVPKISTVADSKDLRGNKVYVDTTLNDYADTLAAVYSIRPYHVPLVSTPLEWKEVKKGLDRYRFTMEKIKERVESKGDLWEGLFDKSIIDENNEGLLKL